MRNLMFTALVAVMFFLFSTSWATPVVTLDDNISTPTTQQESDGTMREEVKTPPATDTAMTDATMAFKATLTATAQDGKDGKDGKGGQNGIDGLNGNDGTNGQSGRDGQNGRAGGRGPRGATGTPGQDAQHDNHNAVKKDIKTWDPAGKHWVDDRIAAHAKKSAAPPAAKPAPVIKTTNHSWMLPLWFWWLLAALLLLLLLILLLRAYGRRIWTWIMSWWPWRRHIINIDRGDYYGEDRAPAVVRVRKCGAMVKKWKGVAVRNHGEHWTWSEAGKASTISAPVGSTVNFALCRENLGCTDISAEGVTIIDHFRSWRYGRFIANSGRLWVGGEKVKNADGTDYVLPDAFINRLLSGGVIRLTELVDEIPASSSVIVAYDILFVPTSGTHGVGPAGAPATPSGTAAAAPMFHLAAIRAARAAATPPVAANAPVVDPNAVAANAANAGP